MNILKTESSCPLYPFQHSFMMFWGNDQGQLRKCLQLAGMFWMLVFMIVTLYSVAILCTRVIGHGNIIGEDADEDLQKIKDLRRLSCRNMNICIDCVHSAQSSGGMCFFWNTPGKTQSCCLDTIPSQCLEAACKLSVMLRKNSIEQVTFLDSRAWTWTYTAAGNVQFSEYFDVHFVRHGEQLEFDEICPPLEESLAFCRNARYGLHLQKGTSLWGWWLSINWDLIGIYN